MIREAAELDHLQAYIPEEVQQAYYEEEPAQA
jgi:hypothetical protein